LLAFVFVFTPVFAVNDYNLSVTVSPKTITTRPCGIATFDVAVNNLGTLEDTYTVIVDGIPTGWYTLSSDSITLSPGKSDKVYLFVTPYCYENKFGTYNGSITLVGKANATDKFTLIVVPDHIIKLTLPEEVTVCLGEEKEVAGILENTGNYTEDVTFTTSGDASAFVKAPEEKVVINTNKKSNVTVALNPVDVQLGSYNLKIDAASATSYATSSASTTVKVVKCYDVEVTSPEQVQACGGKAKTFDITIKNTGLKDDTYTLSMQDLNYSTDVTLGPGESKTLSMDFMNEAEGTYEVAFTVESTFVKKEGKINFVVTKCYGVDLTVDENEFQIESGKGKLVKGKVTNIGLFADTFKIISDVIWSSIRPEQVNLNSNESKDVYAYYSPEYGAQGTYEVNLTAKSDNSQATQQLNIEVLGKGEATTTTIEETTTVEETIPTNETTPAENITTTVEETTQEATTVSETTLETNQTTTPAVEIPTGEVIRGFWENKVMRSLLISIIIVIIILIIIYLVVMR
ncbi:MAG: hypothetical protein NTW30_00870, partial [Candidatus Aenigmarchaeota archaeon]|nr:hypothetical protein [Candidatus Aenigmarchaeota archaeon]